MPPWTYQGRWAPALTNIDSNNIVRWFTDASGDHDFLYDATNYTTLDVPVDVLMNQVREERRYIVSGPSPIRVRAT